jgi:signal transduction histidine kinase
LRLAEVLDNFLRFVSPQKPEKHLVNLYEVVLEVCTLFKNSPLFQEKKLNLNFEYFSKEIFINVDSNQIKQVLWNLLHNARKASEEEGEIRVSLAKMEKWIIVEVSDKGVGMPKSEIEKIQEPFRKGFEQGVGLGLSLVTRIMEQHGGKIEIDSKYGSGTKVKLFFPLE